MKDQRWVRIWLMTGLVMVFFQIIIGGITRLTGSGLSITRWEIVTGTLPPLNAAQWEEAFDLYKATPQYQKINQGMEMSQFKFIFFWEYIHRLWARLMGFVFLIPFIIFLMRGALQRDTIRRLGIVVFLAALAAIFGWIMVASGLIHRPWVNAYKLTIHLGLGISLFIFLFYTWFKERQIPPLQLRAEWKGMIRALIILTIIQICFGGFVSGMKAAMSYPTWPKMNAEWIPSILFDTSHWTVESLLLYDQAGFMPSLVQFIHRLLAYTLFIVSVIFGLRFMRQELKENHWVIFGMVGLLVLQMTLGIITLLGSLGKIPVLPGSLHQAVGILFLTYLFYIKFRSK